jgi:hypothetical protein
MHGPVLSKYDETCYSSLRQERRHLGCTSSRTSKMNNHPRTTNLTRYETSSAALCCLLAFFAAFAAAALAFFASARAAYEDQRWQQAMVRIRYVLPPGCNKAHLLFLLFLLGFFLCPLLLYLFLLFCFLARCSLTFVFLLGLPRFFLFLLDTLDAGIKPGVCVNERDEAYWRLEYPPKSEVNNTSQTCRILLLSASTLGFVLLLRVAFIVATTIRH